MESITVSKAEILGGLEIAARGYVVSMDEGRVRVSRFRSPCIPTVNTWPGDERPAR